MADIVLYPDPRLTRSATARPVDDALRQTGARLLATVRDFEAYGLAAAHLGEIEPLVVVSFATDPAARDYRLLFNPEVEAVAESVASGTEGSVSMPGVQVEIVRPVWADIAYDDETGARQTIRLEGCPARIALHEIEQMQGRFFLEQLSRLKRDMLLKKWRKRAG